MGEVATLWWYGTGMHGWGYSLVIIGMVVFWGAVILGVVALVRYLGGRQWSTIPPARESTPEQLLAERFARGRHRRAGPPSAVGCSPGRHAAQREVNVTVSVLIGYYRSWWLGSLPLR